MKQPSSKRRTLCVWIPNWPLQRSTNARATLKNELLVLYDQPRQGVFQVFACSQSAAEKGILSGMPLAEARALAKVRLEQHDPAADRAALAELAAWCEQFSPLVGIEDPDCLFLDITGLAPLFGSEHALAEQVEHAFRQRDFMVRLAVADTFGLAWAIAHCARNRLTVLASEQSHTALAALPISALRLPEATIAMLAELGITRIGQLLAIPRDTLAARFDPALTLRLDQATGALPETIATEHPIPEITAHVRLEAPAENRKEIDFWLAELIDQIVAALSKRQEGVLRLQCEFRCEAAAPLLMLVGLYRPTISSRHIFDLTRLQLDRLKFPGPVEEIRLAVLSSVRLISHQLDLFRSDDRATDKRELALLIDRLTNRLTPAAVTTARLLPDAQPEYACRHEPIVGQISNLPKSKTKKRPAKNSHQPPTLKPRPLLLEPNPTSLAVLSVVPNGPPIRFHYQGAWQQVAKSWGPERIETGWWRARHIHRDYYRIETTTATRFWLFRQADGKWFLHGIFA